MELDIYLVVCGREGEKRRRVSQKIKATKEWGTLLHRFSPEQEALEAHNTSAFLEEPSLLTSLPPETLFVYDFEKDSHYRAHATLQFSSQSYLSLPKIKIVGV